MKNPSDFAKIFPYSSVARSNETETVARNIMVILSRTGNVWRELSWKEYTEQRDIDGNWSQREKFYFDKAVDYCKSADTAKLFSGEWNQK